MAAGHPERRPARPMAVRQACGRAVGGDRRVRQTSGPGRDRPVRAPSPAARPGPGPLGQETPSA